MTTNGALLAHRFLAPSCLLTTKRNSLPRVHRSKKHKVRTQRAANFKWKNQDTSLLLLLFMGMQHFSNYESYVLHYEFGG